jgi:hypothetical protein
MEALSVNGLLPVGNVAMASPPDKARRHRRTFGHLVLERDPPKSLVSTVVSS